MSKACASTLKKSRANDATRAIEVAPRMRLEHVPQGFGPAAQVGVEEASLRRQVADGEVVAGDQEAHHLAQAGDVVLGLNCSGWRSSPSARRSSRSATSGFSFSAPAMKYDA